MHERPLSDRRRHEPAALQWEVRAWAQPAARVPDEKGWRTIAWSPDHDSAVQVARALVGEGADAVEFAEVWGPPLDVRGRSYVCERFPEPSADEKHEMWLRAASAHYTDGLDLFGAAAKKRSPL